MFGPAGERARLLCGGGRGFSGGRRPVPSKWVELLGDALVRRRQGHMRYQSRGRRAVSERDVSPQRLIHYRNTWYLDAWCHTNEALRRFALDAVQSTEVLRPRAKAVAPKELERRQDPRAGIYRRAHATRY